MSVNLAADEEFCFCFKTPGQEASRISGSFDVLNDELDTDPVTAVLFNYETDEVVWHSKPKTSEGSFSLLNHGKYHFCFGNGVGGYKTAADKKRDQMRLDGHPVPEEDDFDYNNEDGKNRNIGFALRVTPLDGTKMAAIQNQKTATDKDIKADMNKQSTKLADLTYSLKYKMELLLDHQEYIKSREARHRHVVEQTYTMIMRWTFLEALVLIGVSFAQVYYLKRFFETKRFL